MLSTRKAPMIRPKTTNSRMRVLSIVLNTVEKLTLSNHSRSVQTPVKIETTKKPTTSTIAVASNARERRGEAAGVAGRGLVAGGSLKNPLTVVPWFSCSSSVLEGVEQQL